MGDALPGNCKEIRHSQNLQVGFCNLYHLVAVALNFTFAK